jgi:hypothetical protein
MSQSMPYPGAPAQADMRSVLSIPSFRELWNSMAFSSFGDWLGLLAATVLAQQLAGGNYSQANSSNADRITLKNIQLMNPLMGCRCHYIWLCTNANSVGCNT